MITLHPDEEIVTVGVKHWLPLLGFCIATLFLAIAPIVGVVLLRGYSDSFALWSTTYENHLVILEACWMLWLLMAFAVAWTNHYLDLFVVTTKRLIDIDQVSLFNRDIAEVRIENIEDIQVVIPGILASWLDYGSLKVQTASEDNEFVVRNVKNPEEVKLHISRTEDKIRSSMLDR